MIGWTRRIGWVLLATLAILFVVVIYLVADAALDKNVSHRARLFLVVLGVAAIIATLFAGRQVLRTRRAVSLVRPAPIAALTLYLVAFISTMTDALSLLEPRPAVESAPRAIENKVDQTRDNTDAILKRLPAPLPTSRIVEELPGVWGEQNCAVTFRFAIRDQALIVDAERRPAGAPPYRLVARITGSQDDVMEVRGVAPEEAEGVAATFSYEATGDIERLMWDDQVSPHPSELKRCT